MDKQKKKVVNEDEVDAQIAHEAYEEYLKNPKTYSLDEIKEMFNL